MTIKYTIETLFHFRCLECNKWWSIGDWSETKTLICPHCGDEAEVKELEK